MKTYDGERDAISNHGDFVERLARRLVEDVSRADDLVQQAWLAFLAGPPRTPGSLRGWLAGVLRNTARHERRTDERRRRREQEAVRQRLSDTDAGNAPPHAEELRERERMLVAVTDAVRSLDDRYRGVILLRYYENLKPREVAARLDVPVETVRTRTRRALEQIADRLDSSPVTAGGSRRAWALALIPFCRRTPLGASAGAAAGANAGLSSSVAPAMKVSLGIAACAVVALAVWALWPAPDRTAPIELASEPAAAPADTSTVTPTVASSEAADDTVETPTETASATPNEAPVPRESPPVPFHVHGTVIDGLTLEPIADAQVRLVEAHGFRGSPEIITDTRSDEAGRFRFPEESALRVGLGLEVQADGYVPIGGTRSHAISLEASDVTVRLFPGATITGEVIHDHDGSPVVGGIGAILSHLNASAFAGSPQGLLAARFMTLHDSTVFRVDEQGRFTIATLEPLVALEVIGPDYAAAFSEPLRPEPGTSTHVVIRVRQGVPMRGIVRGPDGEPVSGARVNVWPAIEDRFPDHLYFNHQARAEAISDEDGHFEIPNASPFYRSVLVTHANWPDWARHQELTPSDEFLEVELLPCVRLVGRLLPVAGKSHAGTASSSFPGDFERAELRADRQRIAVTIDQDGSFRSAALPPGLAAAVLHIDGWLDTALDWSDLEIDENAGANTLLDLGDVPIERGRALEILVRDSLSGEPIPAARVKLCHANPETRQDETVDERETGPDGRARLSGRAGGALVLQVTRDGYAASREELPSVASGKALPGADGADAVDATVNEPATETTAKATQPLEIALDPGASIRGRVVDAAGRAMVGARLTVRGASPIVWQTATSSSDGRFQIHGIAAGAAFTLHVSADGHLDHSVPIDPLEAGKIIDLGEDIVLSSGATITGRVVDSVGRGVEGATVSVQKAQDAEGLGIRLEPWGVSDASGRFRIAGLSAGKYFVAAGYRGTRTTEQTELGESAEVDVTLRFQELGRGVTWSTVVLDADGNPVHSATVVQRSARFVTDSQGRVTCFDLPAEGQLEIEHERFLTRELKWKSADDLPAVVSLDPGAQIELRVRVVGGKRPRPTWLRVALSRAGKGESTSSVSVDRLGIARFPALAGGDWTLEAWSPDFPLPEPILLTLRSGETRALDFELDARLEPAEIFIVDATGTPIADANVRFDSNDRKAGGARRDTRFLESQRSRKSGLVRSALVHSRSVSLVVEAEGFSTLRLEDAPSHIDRENRIRVTLER